MEKITTRRASEDSYDVLINGVQIGQVWKAWRRNGGDGWTHKTIAASTVKTRKEAVAMLIRDWKKGA